VIRSFDGKTPRIAESALVHDSAVIVGDVEIGEGSSVWPGAVIRGDMGSIRVGRNVHIEDNTVLHGGGLTIGDRVIIGHGAVVEGARIGSNVVVGDNSTILFDVEIGDYCLVGAGAMVGQSTRVPDRSLVVGMPAKIRAELSPRQLEFLDRQLTEYEALVAEYRRQQSFAKKTAEGESDQEL